MSEPILNQDSGSSTSAAQPSETTTSRFIKILNEYKELIGFFVFLMAGVSWGFAYFATKQQLTELKCLMNANISIIQGKADSTSLSQLLQQNQQDSAPLEAKTSLTPAETLKRNQLKTAADDIGRRLAESKTLTAQALTKLKSGQCAGD